MLLVRTTSASSNPATSSENWTSNWTTGSLVGSACPAAWLTVTVGAVVSTVTTAAPADGRLGWPLALMPTVTVPGRTEATTSPSPVIPVTVTVYVLGVTWVTVAVNGPAAVLAD